MSNFRSKYLGQLGIPAGTSTQPPQQDGLPGSLDRDLLRASGDTGVSSSSFSSSTLSSSSAGGADGGRRRARAVTYHTRLHAPDVGGPPPRLPEEQPPNSNIRPRTPQRQQTAPLGTSIGTSPQARGRSRTEPMPVGLGTSVSSSSGLAAALAAAHGELGDVGSVGVGMFAADEDEDFGPGAGVSFGNSLGGEPLLAGSSVPASIYQRAQTPGAGIPYARQDGFTPVSPFAPAHHSLPRTSQGLAQQSAQHSGASPHLADATPGSVITASSSTDLMGGLALGFAEARIASSSSSSTSNEQNRSLSMRPDTTGRQVQEGRGSYGSPNTTGSQHVPLPSSHDAPAQFGFASGTTPGSLAVASASSFHADPLMRDVGRFGSEDEDDFEIDDPVGPRPLSTNFTSDEEGDSDGSNRASDSADGPEPARERRRRPFVPPHVLAAQERQRHGFEVGSGQSLANFNRQQARHNQRF